MSRLTEPPQRAGPHLPLADADDWQAAAGGVRTAGVQGAALQFLKDIDLNPGAQTISCHSHRWGPTLSFKKMAPQNRVNPQGGRRKYKARNKSVDMLADQSSGNSQTLNTG